MSDSRELPNTRTSRGGPRQPDHALTLVVERLSDGAPPFPEVNAALVNCDARLVGYPTGVSSVRTPSAREPKKQEWPIYLYTTNTIAVPTKLIIDVPTAVKEVVLPFEFKRVVLSPRKQ